MKIIATEEAQKLNSIIDDEIENSETPRDYDQLTETEQLAVDAVLYEDGAYIANDFDNIDEWCLKMVNEGGEVQEEFNNVEYYQNQIKRMVELNLVVIN